MTTGRTKRNRPVSEREMAFNAAFRLLSVRARSEAEMRTRLRMKRISVAVIEEVVEKLKAAGHIDDAKFVKAWIEWRMRENPAGGHLLSYELKAKGISDAAIAAALEERRTTYDDFEIARSMAAEKFERLKGIDRRKASKRLYDLLMRRGFEYDVVRRVIEDITR